MLNNLRRNPQIMLAPVILLLLTLAIWGGLVRIGWSLPVGMPSLIMLHGPLMVAGFFATVISLERAVALRQWWMFLAPFATALASVSFLIIGIQPINLILLVLSGLILGAIFGLLLRQHPALYTAILGLGALCWLVGNLLWLLGYSLPVISMWWSGFLILTIGGERLELGRLLRLKPTVQRAFIGLVALQVLGLVLVLFDYRWGLRICGITWLGLALWLLRYDITRRTVRKTGLTRFIAVCMLTGYAWLGIGGLFAIFNDGTQAGLRYDAQLHSIFVGFVFTMIFGHAPIIIPALLKIQIQYNPRFYWHVGLLHASLMLRILGDMTLNLSLRRWGGMLNALAILLFLTMTVLAVQRRTGPKPSVSRNVVPRE